MSRRLTKERRTKTDRVDAAKLARSLANGELTPIYVPERAAREDRTLIRMRMEFVHKQTRTTNQIWTSRAKGGLLLCH